MYINQQVIGVNEVNLTLIIVIINLMIIDYRMYINFWYPIILAKELRQEKPVKVKVLGMDLVVYKTTDGTINVLSDTCCHRGGSLGGKWNGGKDNKRIINNCIVCPYHGWEFDGTGKCTNIPSMGYGSKIPSRARIDSYPVEEKYEIIFAFLGDLEEKNRPPILNIEEYNQEGWRTNEVACFEVDYYYERSIENGIDPAHNEFVHPTHGFSGANRDTYKVNPIITEDHKQGWGFWFMHTFDAPPLKDDKKQIKKGKTLWKETKPTRSPVKAGGGTIGPNVVVTQIKITPEQSFRQYFFEQPIDENRTKIFFVNNRNFMLNPTMDPLIYERNLVIAQQDIDILEDVAPTQTPLMNNEEVLVPADAPIAEYRKWLKKFKNLGWKIDLKKLRTSNTDQEVFAIPSPGRKQSKNYPIKSIPLIKAEVSKGTILRLKNN
ncbi:MAG: aromatic ring-hydroxylating dioxygenase subunit alpha [Candidatus Marinimicrobia bacterium]|jgi:phenylpropionate dioxygenase-like ring-hydroxylating dioxygenase large terminal subunit|nr:aromatic ring-hydroxylating dioxygenase subunit alpha [Candidatus Neomarinimicrobiota bacterium]MBT7580975.1 aromatic ring-hydroxylating dioxygenase subunit alpha [Candidatus Neomarinimicrobiota bacterium]